MKFNKGAIAGIALAGITLASGIVGSHAMAATNQFVKPTHIYVNGHNISNPNHVIATDPWGNNLTSWVPIYYLQQALKQYGFQTDWNGTTLKFTKIPDGWSIFADSYAAGSATKDEMQFRIGNNTPPAENAPKLVTQDPASGVETTYVPVYYVNSVLKHYFHMGATWNGTNGMAQMEWHKWNGTNGMAQMECGNLHHRLAVFFKIAFSSRRAFASGLSLLPPTKEQKDPL